MMKVLLIEKRIYLLFFQPMLPHKVLCYIHAMRLHEFVRNLLTALHVLLTVSVIVFFGELIV